MKLDPRIKDISKILLRNEMDKAKKYVRTKCYFGNDLVDFIDIDNECFLGTLTNVDELDDIEPYEGKIERVDVEPYFSYLLPAEFVEEEKPKENKYIPFETIHDLAKANLHIGNIVNFICKDYPDVIHRAVVNEVNYREVETAYDETKEEVIDITLGSTTYSFKTLYDDYKYLDRNEEWVPFGKKEEKND